MVNVLVAVSRVNWCVICEWFKSFLPDTNKRLSNLKTRKSIYCVIQYKYE